MVVLLLACTVFLMIRRGRKKVALLHKHTALVSSSTKPGVTINMKDLKHMSTPIINNGLSRSRLSVKSKVNTIGSVDSKKTKKSTLYGHVAGEESDSENSSVYHEPYKLLPQRETGVRLSAEEGRHLVEQERGVHRLVGLLFLFADGQKTSIG
jgi:discoidin domain receptor family protein 2